jgi:hypothetical protein
MKLKGPYSGIDNQIYKIAFIFFKKRELANIMPFKRKKVNAKDLDKFNIGDPILKLNGENEGEIKIYDTCVKIRRKINIYFCEGGVIKAGLCRIFNKITLNKTPINAKSMDDFLKKRGP